MARRLGRGWTDAHDSARHALIRADGKRDGGKAEVAAVIERGGDVNAGNPVRAAPAAAHAVTHPACLTRARARAPLHVSRIHV